MKAKGLPNSTHHRKRKLIVYLVLAASTTGHSVSIHATGWPVVDIAAVTNALQNYSDQLTRWTATVAQYKEVVSHYQSVVSHHVAQVAFWKEQLNNLRQLKLDLFDIEQGFLPVPENYGVDVMCPGASSSLVESATAALTSAINPDSDVIGEQRKVCTKIVRTQNRKYNDTVEYLKSLRVSTETFLQITALLSDVKNSPGNTAGLTSETERYSANMQLAKDKWQTAIEQYNVQLALLNQQKTVLSRRAMNGKPSLWGTLINTAALQRALRINE